jgi:hypothetical protein
MAVVTYGMHRIGNITQRTEYGLNQQVVPGATIYVTLTSSGAGATIYSDPGMSITIPGSLITADQSGSYDYYIPLSYNVTETISSTSGLLLTITNVVQNGPVAASLTTTANATDVVSIPGFTGSGHVSLTATNSTAAGMIASTYVSAKGTNSITVTHPSTANATFDIVATPY